jgi:hypothetical protein
MLWPAASIYRRPSAKVRPPSARPLARDAAAGKPISSADPELVETARQLSERRPRLSLREISAELAASGYLASSGQPFSASAVSAMLD